MYKKHKLNEWWRNDEGASEFNRCHSDSVPDLAHGLPQLVRYQLGKSWSDDYCRGINEIARLTYSTVYISNVTSDTVHSISSVDLNVSRYESEFGEFMKTPFSHGIEKTLNWLRES